MVRGGDTFTALLACVAALAGRLGDRSLGPAYPVAGGFDQADHASFDQGTLGIRSMAGPGSSGRWKLPSPPSLRCSHGTGQSPASHTSSAKMDDGPLVAAEQVDSGGPAVAPVYQAIEIRAEEGGSESQGLISWPLIRA